MASSKRGGLLGIGVGLAIAVSLGAWWLAGRGPAGPGAQAIDGVAAERGSPGNAEAQGAPSEPLASASGAARTPAAAEETTSAASPAPTRRLRGRLELPGRAVPDPELVVALRSGVGEGRTELLAAPNALGRFEFDVPSGARRVSLSLERGYHYLPEPLQVELEGGVEERELVLAPRLGARLVARLVPTDGSDPRPHEGFTVRVLSADLPMGVRTLTFDERGRSRFDGLPAESQLLVALVAPGYALRSDLIEVPVSLTLLAGRDRELEFPIEREVVLAGTVRSPDGAPLARARVATERSEANEYDSGTSVRTDEGGRFELRGLRSGARALRADHDGFLATELDLGVLRPGEERADLEVVLGTGSELAGRLLWPDGTPAQGVTVFLFEAPEPGADPSPFELASVRLRTDDQGRFSTAGLQTPGPFELRATARPRGELAERLAAAGMLPEEGRRRAELNVRRQGVRAGERDLVLMLTGGETLRGRVVDPTGRPVARARLVVQPARGFPVHHNVRDADGTFSISGLEPGRYTLSASAGAGRGAEVELEVPQRSGEVLVVAPLGASVVGRVTAGGVPVSGAAVNLRHGPHGRSLFANARVVFEDLEKETHSDEQGQFEFPIVVPGEQVLEAELAGVGRSASVAAHVTEGEALTGVVLELQPLGWIEGRLGDGIEPRFGRAITVQDDPGGSYEVVRTDSDGRFEVQHLRQGLYSLELSPVDDAQSGERGFDLPVRVEAGRGTQVVLAPPQRAVTVVGRVARASGPVVDQELRIRLLAGPPHGRIVARTDEQGAFRVELPRPGRVLFDFGLGARASPTHVIADQPLVEISIALPMPRTDD